MEKTLTLFLAAKPRNTVRSYGSAIRQFGAWLRGHRKRHVKATVKDAVEYLTSLISSHAPATVSNRHGALASYYAYLQAIGEIEKNPFQLAKALIPRRQRHQVRPTARITPDIVKTMLNLPDRRTQKGVRDRAILSALFGGGLRRSELLKIKLGQIVCTVEGTLTLKLDHTKNGLDQEQVLRGRFAERVVELVAQRKTEGATNEDRLIVNYFRDHLKPMSEKTLYRLFRRYAKEVGVRAAPHAARAAFITKLLMQGYRLIDVKKAARHAAYQTVEAYDHRILEPTTAPTPQFF